MPPKLITKVMSVTVILITSQYSYGACIRNSGRRVLAGIDFLDACCPVVGPWQYSSYLMHVANVVPRSIPLPLLDQLSTHNILALKVLMPASHILPVCGRVYQLRRTRLDKLPLKRGLHFEMACRIQDSHFRLSQIL